MTWNPFTLRKQLKTSEELNKKLHSQNTQLSLKNGLLTKENERSRAESSRLKKEYEQLEQTYNSLYTDWQKVVAANAEFERKANAHLLTPKKHHGKHRQQRGRK